MKPCDWNWLICPLMWQVFFSPGFARPDTPIHSIWYSFSARKIFPRWLSREFLSREKITMSWRHLYSSVTWYRYSSFYANSRDTNAFDRRFPFYLLDLLLLLFCVRIKVTVTPILNEQIMLYHKYVIPTFCTF